MESRVTILTLGLALSAVSCSSIKKTESEPSASQPPAESAAPARTTGQLPDPNLHRTAASRPFEPLSLHKRGSASQPPAAEQQLEAAAPPAETTASEARAAEASERSSEAENASGGQSAPSSPSSTPAPRADTEGDADKSRSWSLLGVLGLLGLAGLLGAGRRAENRTPRPTAGLEPRVRIYDTRT